MNNKHREPITKCIFKRCDACNKLLLHGEKHQCNKVRTSKAWQLAESVFHMLDAANEEMNQVDIAKVVNKEIGFRRYTQFEIAYHLNARPQIFVKGNKPYHWALKIWEKEA